MMIRFTVSHFPIVPVTYNSLQYYCSGSREYARSIMALVDAPIFTSEHPRRLILVGHSGGACAV